MQRSEQELRSVVERVDCPGYELCVFVCNNLPYLQVRSGKFSGRKWLLSHWMVDSEIVSTCLKAILTFAEHEIREAFRYRGCPVYGPHISVDALAEVCHRIEAR